MHLKKNMFLLTIHVVNTLIIEIYAEITLEQFPFEAHRRNVSLKLFIVRYIFVKFLSTKWR